MPESIRGRFRHPGWIAGGVVAVATTVLAVVAVLDYTRPPDARGTDSVVPSMPGRPATTDAPTGTPDPGAGNAASATIRLDELTVVSGASRLAPLPDELADHPAYQRAVVIACPSNQTGDQISEVTYETRHRYSTMDVELRPYRDPPDDILVNLRVFSDPQDRLPGAPPPGEPHLEQLRMGETRSVPGIGIGDSYYLRLRVECEKPGGYMILTGTVLHRAT